MPTKDIQSKFNDILEHYKKNEPKQMATLFNQLISPQKAECFKYFAEIGYASDASVMIQEIFLNSSIAGTTNDDIPFVEGEHIIYGNVPAIVKTNDGDSGLVLIEGVTETWHWKCVSIDCVRA